MAIEYKEFGIRDENGNLIELQGYDIWWDGTWCGSRNTIQACEDFVWWCQNADRIKAERQAQIEADKKERKQVKNARIEHIEQSQPADDKLKDLCQNIINANVAKVTEAKTKPKAFDWFVGQAMKQTKDFHPLVIRKTFQTLILGE